MNLLRGFAKLTGTVVACAGMAVYAAGERVYDSLSGERDQRRDALLVEARRMNEADEEIICNSCKRPIEDRAYVADTVNYQTKGYHCQQCHEEQEAAWACGGG